MSPAERAAGPARRRHRQDAGGLRVLRRPRHPPGPLRRHDRRPSLRDGVDERRARPPPAAPPHHRRAGRAGQERPARDPVRRRARARRADARAGARGRGAPHPLHRLAALHRAQRGRPRRSSAAGPRPAAGDGTGRAGDGRAREPDRDGGRRAPASGSSPSTGPRCATPSTPPCTRRSPPPCAPPTPTRRSAPSS